MTSQQPTAEPRGWSRPCACGPPLSLAHGEAKAALELVLAVVEEGAEDQGERQGQQLFLQRGTNYPVAVQRACNTGKRRASSSQFPRLPRMVKHQGMLTEAPTQQLISTLIY